MDTGTKINSGKLRRKSFIQDTRKLQHSMNEQYPTEGQVTPPHSGPPPHTDKLQDITINNKVPYLTTKDEHSDKSRRALILAILDKRYPYEVYI
jgi:hypothetical protein